MAAAPRISVVIPAYNRPGLLADGLDSIMHQTMAEWEAVVVDDGSNPPIPAAEFAQRFGPRVRVLRNDKSKGGPAAKTAGARAAAAEVLAFLDDDDLYAPAYLERALYVLDKYPDVQVVFMGVSWFGASAQWGEQAYRETLQKTLAAAQGSEVEPGVMRFGEALLPALLERIPMAFQRAVMRRSAFDRIGGYRDGCIRWDCDWALRAVMELPVALVTEGLYRQRAEGQGFASNKDRQLQQLVCGVDIKETLLQSALRQERPAGSIDLLREAAARNWFELAHYHYLAGAPAKALSAWAASQRRFFSLARAKLLPRLLLSWLGLQRQREK